MLNQLATYEGITTMLSDLPGILTFFILLGIWVLIFYYIGRYIISYHIGERSFCIRLFHLLPVLMMHYDEIAEVRQISLAEALVTNTFLTLRWGNRFRGDIVMITRKRWKFYKYLFITPDDAPQFVHEICGHIGPMKNNGTPG